MSFDLQSRGNAVLATERALRQRLIDFIQASDPIRDLQTHNERRRLLEEPGAISAIPALEITPTYFAGPRLTEIGLSPDLGAILSYFAERQVGVYNPPYLHQAEAYRAILVDRSDVLVASGTGSGKTETFLHPILARLGVEARFAPQNFVQPGFRTLILYPMNALVSDQIARLRRLFGAPVVSNFFIDLAGIPARFGMYTGRTPYPGIASSKRNKDELGSITQYYLDLEQNDSQLFAELRELGRVPVKSLVAIATALRDSTPPTTQQHDVELLTRQEIQAWCPHTLVTNYSMLEYMLMRPIERRIFEQTREFYRRESDSSLLIVLDEAHLYRGVAGGEVSFLLRRLLSRLGLDRDRVQFILTSASMGEGEEARDAASKFAYDLVGRPSGARFPLQIITGTLARLPQLARAEKSSAMAEALARVPQALIAALDSYEQYSPESLDELQRVGIRIDTSVSSEKSEQLGHALQQWPLLEELHSIIHGTPTNVENICNALFPNLESDQSRNALQNLIEIAGRGTVDGRSVLHARLHLFFRGIPPVFACVNPDCSAIEANEQVSGLGKLYVAPRLHCDCGARTYELLIHRDCGARFLRVYETDARGDFFWHEGGRQLSENSALSPVQLLIDAPHRTAVSDCHAIYVNIWTGRVQRNVPENNAIDWRKCFRPKRKSTSLTPRQTSGLRYTPTVKGRDLAESTFGNCPACNKRNGGRYIRSLGTVGDRPFATLVREQLLLQPQVKEFSDRHPNGGRKSLIFSDGRQRAARLARDLPREIELDGFRQAILLGARRLQKIGVEPTLDRYLYTAFLSVCSDFHLTFFDQEGEAQRRLADDIADYRRNNSSLEEVDFDDVPLPLDRFNLALYRQVSDPNYSLYEINIGYLAPTRKRLRRLRKPEKLAPFWEAIPDDWSLVLGLWVQSLLERGAFDPTIGTYARLSVRAFPDIAETYPIEESIPQSILERLSAVGSLEGVTELVQQDLTKSVSGGRTLDPSGLAVRIAIDDDWWCCQNCYQFFPLPIFGLCPQCGDATIERCPPSHPLLQARSEYFRDGVRRVLAGDRPINLVAEEHTAQLSHRDRQQVWATTEKYELRFQDLRVDGTSPPIDILSCTTTMEVGIDIGSLNAVGLGNVPPQRENYQQRAGRAGRRGGRATTVMTYARDNAHDAHYFEDVTAMVAGPPRKPRVDADNSRIAARHINALLIQTFFHRNLNDDKQYVEPNRSADLFSSLGTVSDFYEKTPSGYTFLEFQDWIQRDAITAIVPGMILERIAGLESVSSQSRYLQELVDELLGNLEGLGAGLTNGLIPPKDKLLDVLFDRGLLPSYAFPTDLCSFVIQRRGSQGRPEIEQKPQQDKLRALSEYAPGRKLIVDKRTYTVGGVFVDGAGKPDERFQRYFEQALSTIVYCPRCTYIGTEADVQVVDLCPVCGSPLQTRSAIDPPAFSPRAGKADSDQDSQQTFTSATQAQFPLPLEQELLEFNPAGKFLEKAFKRNQRLVVSNTGRDDKGFLICGKCGAIQPKLGDEDEIGEHHVPFLGFKGSSFRCNGSTFELPIALSHEFATDLLLVRGQLAPPLVTSPIASRLQDALRTLAEALSLAASYLIDADPGELASGYRFLPKYDGCLTFEIFLYDSASGGAGYALEAGEQFNSLLDRAEALLETCPVNCDRSCTRCLRHYGNLTWHEHLDRHLARTLLRYLRYGELPTQPDGQTSISLLLPLQRFLELEGLECGIANGASNQAHLVLSRNGTNQTVRVRASLLSGDKVQSSGSEVSVCEYELTRNLPTVASLLS